MKKIIAGLLTITAPIWFLPVAILFLVVMGFAETYKNILKLLNKI